MAWCLEGREDGLGQDPAEVVRYLLAVSRAQEAGFRGKEARPERSMIEEQAFYVFFWAHESGTRLLRRSTKVTIYVSAMIIMRSE